MNVRIACTTVIRPLYKEQKVILTVVMTVNCDTKIRQASMKVRMYTLLGG